MKNRVRWLFFLFSFALSASSWGATATVDISNFLFVPTPRTINVGDAVRWTNNDGVPHTTTSTGAETWDSGSLSQGGTFSHTFPTAGTFDYFCGIHPEMHGTIIVQGGAQAPTVT